MLEFYEGFSKCEAIICIIVPIDNKTVSQSDLVSGVGERLAHGKLVVLVLLVKAEGKAEDVGVAVGGRPGE